MCRELADRADIVVTGGDDITPDFKKKAEKIAAECYERYPDGYFVMQPTGDELPGTDQICGSPWIGKGWIKRAYRGQGAFCPDYFIFFGDEELKNVAQLRGVLWQRRDLLQYHDHWTRTGGPKKTDYQVGNDRNWNNDEAVFKARKADGFPGHEPT
jgi:hypothetical protein